MTITKFTCFLNGFLETKEVALGRLVTDTWNPGRNFRDSGSLVLTFDKDIARRPFGDIQSLTNASSSSKISAMLSKFATAFVSRSGDASDDINTPMGITYKLLNTDDIFGEVCQDESVQRWSEKAIEYGKDVFFLTGFITLRDAKVNATNEKETVFDGSVQVPATAAVTHGSSETLPAEVAGVVDMKAKIEHNRQLATAATFTSLGERVVAVEYQKLEFKLFSSKTVQSAQLGKPHWRIFTKDRGGTGSDSIEASLGCFKGPEALRTLGETAEMSTTLEGDVFIINEQA